MLRQTFADSKQCSKTSAGLHLGLRAKLSRIIGELLPPMSRSQIGPSTKEPMAALPPMDYRQSSESRSISAAEDTDYCARLVKISLCLQTFGYVLNLIEDGRGEA